MKGQMGRINREIVFPELRVGEHQTEYLKRIGCPAGHLPTVMQPLNPHWRVMFMWNQWNPFQPRGKWNPQLPAMFDACVGQPRWKVLVMLFGWTERIGQLALGNFNPEVHVMRGAAREALDAQIRAGEATIYMADDPETQRSHALLWLAVFRSGMCYLFDESPRANEGPWVNVNGEAGEGQFVYARTGANWYKGYIRQREREWGIAEVNRMNLRTQPPPAGEVVHERLVQRRGDPRGFATEESTATGTRSMFDLFREDHSDPKEGGHGDWYPMLFLPAKVRRATSLDLDIIIDLLKYDEDRAMREGGLSAENTPRLFVSERCENFIRCALNYALSETGKADESNPWRDFIDAARYLFSMGTPFIEADGKGVGYSGGSWG